MGFGGGGIALLSRVPGRELTSLSEVSSLMAPMPSFSSGEAFRENVGSRLLLLACFEVAPESVLPPLSPACCSLFAKSVGTSNMDIGRDLLPVFAGFRAAGSFDAMIDVCVGKILISVDFVFLSWVLTTASNRESC